MHVYNYKPVFKSCEYDGICGYSGSGKSLLDIYERKFYHKPELKKISAHPFCQVGENCYRGHTLTGCPDKLAKLKKYGVERVIDLAGYPGYEDECGKNGLDYFAFPLKENIGDEAAYFNQEAYMKNGVIERRCYRLPEKEIQDFIQSAGKIHSESSREFIGKLIDFIHVLNEGNFYIACQFGHDRTNRALVMNSVFNPQYKNFIDTEPLQPENIGYMRNLYNKLADEDKKAMGYTEEFDAEVFRKLNV